LRNEEFHNLFPSPNINGVMKSWRWTDHVACMGRSEMHAEL